MATKHSHHYDAQTGELKRYPPGVNPLNTYRLRGRTEDYYVCEIVRLRQQNKRQRTKIQQLTQSAQRLQNHHE